MSGIDLIVQCMTMSTIEPDQVAGLIAAVEAGTGLAGWHGGIADAYRASADYLQLIGGQFAAHAARMAPGERTGEQADNYVRHRITMTPAGRRAPDHRRDRATSTSTPSSTGCCTDDYVDVLATTTTARPAVGRLAPAGHHARRSGPGSGAAAGSSSRRPGHKVEVLQDPNVRTIVERGLLWAAR